MRQAPPVRVEFHPPRVWQALQALLPALALGVLIGWAAQRLGWGGVQALSAAAPAAVALAVALWWHSSAASRVLAWDGAAWALEGVTGAVQPMIDVRSGLVLTFTADASPGREWLALGGEAAAHPGLRAALYASRPAARQWLATRAERDL